MHNREGGPAWAMYTWWMPVKTQYGQTVQHAVWVWKTPERSTLLVLTDYWVFQHQSPLLRAYSAYSVSCWDPMHFWEWNLASGIIVNIKFAQLSWKSHNFYLPILPTVYKLNGIPIYLSVLSMFVGCAFCQRAWAPIHQNLQLLIVWILRQLYHSLC